MGLGRKSKVVQQFYRGGEHKFSPTLACVNGKSELSSVVSMRWRRFGTNGRSEEISGCLRLMEQSLERSACGARRSPGVPCGILAGHFHFGLPPISFAMQW